MKHLGFTSGGHRADASPRRRPRWVAALVVVLFGLVLLSGQVPTQAIAEIVAETQAATTAADSSEQPSDTETTDTTGTGTEATTETEASLYEQLMAAATAEEMDGILSALEDEPVFTDGELAALIAKVQALEDGDAKNAVLSNLEYLSTGENSVEATADTSNLNWSNTINGSGQTTVKFFVQLDSVIADAEQGGTGTTPSGNYTGAVYTTTISAHPTTYKGIMDSENAYVVIQGATDGTAYAVDSDIRTLATGYSAATVNGSDFKFSGFPTDAQVFSAIQGGAGAGKNIKVNGKTIDKSSLNTNNWAVRWYVFKYNWSDCWHIDGILVPKYGQMTVTKTFKADTNEDLKAVLNSVYSGFQVDVHGVRTSDSLVKDDHLKLSSVTTTNEISALNGTEVTYKWTVDVMKGSYTINESNTSSDNYTLSSQKFKYKENGGTETSYSNLPSTGGTMTCVTKADDDTSTLDQSCALENTYTRKNVTLTLTKKVTGNMGDKSKEFTFTVSTNTGTLAVPTNGNATLNSDGTVTAQLHNDETATITVPYGADITIAETTVTGYTTTYKVGSETTGASGNKCTVSSINADTSVEFTNTKEVTIDTGISLDSTGPIAIGVIAAAGIAAAVVRGKRRAGSED